MIFAHPLVGFMPIADNHFNWFWFIGSIIPDVDHLFVFYQHKIFSFRKGWETAKYEDKYNLRFKTKYMHSLFGAIIFSLPIMFFTQKGGIYFFLAYIFHLVLDWPDRDEKQYFYPFNLKVRGWLPIFSSFEKAFTFILILMLVYLYK